MSATSPRRCRWSGRSRQQPLRRNHPMTLGDVVEKLQRGQPFRRAEGAGRPARRRRHPGPLRLIKLVTGGLQDRRLGAARQAGAGRFRRRRGQRDRGALAWADAALCRAVPWLEGKAPKAREAGGGAVPAGHAVQSRSEQADLEKLAPCRLCGRMEMGRHPRPGGQRARRAPALFAHRRRCLAGLSRPGRGDELRRRARRRAAGRPAAASGPARSPTCSSG